MHNHFYCWNFIDLIFNLIFTVKSDFELTETYTETWARIMHSAFVSYFSLKEKKNKDNIILIISFSTAILLLHYNVNQEEKLDKKTSIYLIFQLSKLIF